MFAGRATPPDNAKKGDIWFKDTGGGDVELYEFDGVNWIRKMYKGFGDDVRQLVDSKIAEANVTVTEALEEHDNTISQAMTKAGQANDLAQQAKTESANASLSASAANQDAQQAITDAASAKESALDAITKADDTRTELLGLVGTLDTKTTDIQTSITKQDDKIELKAEKTYVDTVKQTVDSHTTSITQQAGQISLKANQTELNNLTGRMSTAESSITQQAGQISLKASTTDVNNLTGRVATAEGNITTQDGQIALKAEKTYVDTVKQTVDSTTSRVTLTEQSITSLVSGVKTLPDGRTSVFATKIESLEGAITQRVTTQELNAKGYQTASQVNTIVDGKIPTYVGGRNLAQKTSSDWSTPYTSFSGSDNTCPQLYKVLVDDLAVGDTLKTRIVLKYTNIVPASGRTARIWLQGDGNVTGWSTGRYSDSTYLPISGSGEMVFEHEFEITADHLKNQFWNWMFRTDYIASGSLQWKLAKVEKGSLWTAWLPAPEDTEAALTDKLAGYVTNQTYTTYTTNRQQTDTQITEQINRTVSKVPTGPVNLIVNGFDPQTISPWKLWDTTNWTLELTTHGFFYNGTKKLMRFKTSTSTTKGTFESNVYNLKRNTKYTIRVGIFANSNCKELRFCFGRGTSAASITDFGQAHPWFVGNQTKLEYKTITVDSGNFDYGKLTFDHNGTKTAGQWAEMYIAEISIIEGEYNNSWTPSFDELITEQKFNETKSTVDAFSRAIGTRDETGFVPNIARLVMTQDAVISEVAKYGEHNNNLIVDATSHAQTEAIGGASVLKYPLENRIDFIRSGATTNTYPGISCKVHASRFITGEKYTVSFDYYLSQAPDSNLYVRLTELSTIIGGGNIFATPSTATGVWIKYTVTFAVFNDSKPGSNYIRFLIFAEKNASVAIKNIMFVRGAKIGPFSTSQVDVVSTRVEQTANSYSVKFLNNANDITTQLNLTSSGARIKSSLIQLDGNVTVSGTAWMDGAVIKNLSADKITTGTLNANNVNITNLSVDKVYGITATYLQSIIGTAFIDWMKGKIIQGYNNNMTIDLLGGNITLNSGSNAIKRVKGTHTAFVHFNDVDSSYDGNAGSLYASIGVTSSGDGVNSMSSGRFAGLRAFRAASGTQHNATIDQTEIYGDTILFKDDFALARGFRINPVYLDKQYDLNDDILNPIRFFTKLLIHLNNVGWNWQNGAFLDALNNEWNYFKMSRYGTFRNNTIYKP